MKLYAQFFNKPMEAYPQLNPATGRYEVMPNPDPVTPIEATGTAGVLQLDARYNTIAHYATCQRYAKNNGYVGYQLVKANRFTNMGDRSKLILV